MNPLQLLLLCLAGWVNRHQQHVIEYLQEEVKVPKEQLGKRPRFNDDQRRTLAEKAKRVYPERLKGLSPLVTPRTLLKVAPALHPAMRCWAVPGGPVRKGSSAQPTTGCAGRTADSAVLHH